MFGSQALLKLVHRDAVLCETRNRRGSQADEQSNRPHFPHFATPPYEDEFLRDFAA
jgi:hypothetical protein